MNTEKLPELRRRAAKHAALSDPARLLIVDTLSLGDASPSELQALLAMPSNLLAHHLKILENEGMLVRGPGPKPTGGAATCTCAPGALDGIVAGVRLARRCGSCSCAPPTRPAPSWPPRCGGEPVPSRPRPLGPIPRSASIPAPSRPRTGTICRCGCCDRAGWSTSWTTRISSITVCDHAHEELGHVHGLHWSVPDPVRVGTDDAFDAAFDDLARRVSDLAPRITAS